MNLSLGRCQLRLNARLRIRDLTLLILERLDLLLRRFLCDDGVVKDSLHLLMLRIQLIDPRHEGVPLALSVFDCLALRFAVTAARLALRQAFRLPVFCLSSGPLLAQLGSGRVSGSLTGAHLELLNLRTLILKFRLLDRQLIGGIRTIL